MAIRDYGAPKVKNKVAINREYGWAKFVFEGSTTSNTIDLGPAASIAIRCPASESTKTCSVQTTFDGSTWVELASITLATGMNFFTGDNAVKIMHCQDTRLVLGSATTGTVTLHVSVIG